MRPGIIWLERTAHHLKLHKREALDAGDAAAHLADTAAIATLTELTHLQKREYRAQAKQLAESNAKAKSVLVEVEPHRQELEQVAA